MDIPTASLNVKVSITLSKTLTFLRPAFKPLISSLDNFPPAIQETNMTTDKKDRGMPIAITLDPGVYYRFEIDKRQKVFICGCGLTGDQPFCDGSCGVSPAGRQ
jgi:hypothetical protein